MTLLRPPVIPSRALEAGVCPLGGEGPGTRFTHGSQVACVQRGLAQGFSEGAGQGDAPGSLPSWEPGAVPDASWGC